MVFVETMMDARVSGLKGGLKQMWLKQHCKEVLAFRAAHGDEKTLEQFNMRPSTLENVLNPRAQNFEKMTKAERAYFKAEQAIAASNEINRRMGDIEDTIEELYPMVQIAYAFIGAVQRMMPPVELKQFKVHNDFNFLQEGSTR